MIAPDNKFQAVLPDLTTFIPALEAAYPLGWEVVQDVGPNPARTLVLRASWHFAYLDLVPAFRDELADKPRFDGWAIQYHCPAGGLLRIFGCYVTAPEKPEEAVRWWIKHSQENLEQWRKRLEELEPRPGAMSEERAREIVAGLVSHVFYRTTGMGSPEDLSEVSLEDMLEAQRIVGELNARPANAAGVSVMQLTLTTDLIAAIYTLVHASKSMEEAQRVLAVLPGNARFPGGLGLIAAGVSRS